MRLPVLPLIIQCLQILRKDYYASAKPGIQTACLRSKSQKGHDEAGWTGLGLKVGGLTWYPLCIWDTVIKEGEQTLPSVWLKMERYLQFLNIYGICFGCNLLRLLKVKPKDAIRISCRWSSVIFCDEIHFLDLEPHTTTCSLHEQKL